MEQLIVNTLSSIKRMVENNSFIFGGVASIFSTAYLKLQGVQHFGEIHIYLLLILLSIITCDFILGSRISKKNLKYESNIAIDAIIRDGIMLALATVCYLIDQIVGTGALIFAVFVFALCYCNVQSVMANIYVMGWQKYFPIWLIKWVDSEIRIKFLKIYHPEEKKSMEKGAKQNGKQQ